MNKITYWMRKMGMLRTSSYKVSGDAEKLNEIQANDGEMLQSQKGIDEKYGEQSENKKTSENQEKQ
ncbi:MAG: hypothetical protein U9Q12_03695 [Patescibacteria group bacterium]|nr:hypothetical protein [Patescibacteria group bacterium]